MKKRGRKKRRFKTRMIAEAAIRIAAWFAALGVSGYLAFTHIDGLKNLTKDDIANFLNNALALEQDDDSYVSDEPNNEIATEEEAKEDSKVEIEEVEKEENSSVDPADTIPYPDIIPELDYERTSSEIYEMEVEIPPIDWDYVNKVNADANAWLYLPGVGPDGGVSLPVVQGDDNEYYLNHDIYGNSDKRGTLFIDCHNNPLDSETQELSDVTCIYGHNMKHGEMLAPICNYKSQAFYDRHPYGVIIAENGEVYKIDFFAGVIVDGSDYLNVYASDFIDESQFNAYFDNIISNSTFDSYITVEFRDKIILLQTCSYEYSDAKYVLYGRLTRQIIIEQEVQNTLRR